MNWRSGLNVVLVSLIFTLGGCFGEGGPSGDPEEVAHEAFRSFGTSVSSEDGGDIKQISGSFEMAEEALDGDDMGMGFGDGSLEMTIEWGRFGVVHATYGMASGGMTMNLEAWCGPDQDVIKWGNDIIEGRGNAGFGGGDDLCTMSTEMEEMEMGSGLDIFASENFEGLELQDIETNSDGSISATFIDTEEEGTMVVLIDKKGRIVRLEMDSPEGQGTFDIGYGARETIQIPEATVRMPAQLYASDSLEEGTLLGTIHSSDDAPPLDEMELRLVSRDWEKDTKEVMVRFALLAGEEQTSDGYAFTYDDVDGDGRVSENDTYTLSHPGWENEYWIDGEIMFYDLWAEGYANESPVPAPGIALLVLSLIGLAYVGRRRG